MALFQGHVSLRGVYLFLLYMVYPNIHHVSSISRLSRLIHEYLCQRFTYFFRAVPVSWRCNRPVSATSCGPTTDKGCQMKFWQLLLRLYFCKITNTWLYVRGNHPKRGVLLLRTQIRFAQASRSMKSISNRSFCQILSGFMFLVLSGYTMMSFFFSLALVFEARDCKCKFQNSMDRISSRVVC